MLTNVTRVVYGLFGVLYLVIGAGSIVLPLGWLPQSVQEDVLSQAAPSAHLDHLHQEFGTVVLVLGCIFLWYARRKELSSGFHWLVTVYFLSNAAIHWVGPDGVIGSWSRGIVNSTPFVLMLLLGLLRLRVARLRREVSSGQTAFS